MPATRRSKPTADAWLLTAALGYHAGELTADQYRRVMEQLRRHAEPEQVLDHSAPVRDPAEQHPE